VKPDLHSSPLVVATVTQKSDLDFLKAETFSGSNVLEFRLDNLRDQASEALESMATSPLPVLTTVRSSLEGGAGNLSTEQRVSLYTEALPYSHLLDIEVESLRGGGFSELMSEAAARGIQRIGSFHDFDTFPGIDVLRDTISEAFSLDADVAKLAVHLDNRSQLYALAELVSETRTTGRLISAMGMGPLGKLSRLVLPEAGSCLNYGYLQVANAPGQWSAAELSALLQQLSEPGNPPG